MIVKVNIKKNSVFRCLGLWLIILSTSVCGETLARLGIDDDKINRAPWQSYQKIQNFNQPSKQLSPNEYLQFLVYKAQAEHLLYFYDKLDRTVNLALSLITEATPLNITSSLNLFAGMSAQRHSRYNDSVALLSLAFDQARAADLPRIYIMAKNELAYTRSIFEFYETSLTEIQQAYVDAYALNDQFLLASIHETYGAIYGYLKEYKKSIDYYEKALMTYELLGYKAHAAEAIYGMAATYRYWGKYNQAIEQFKIYSNKLTYTPNNDISFFGLYGLAITYAEKGDCKQALPAIEKALTLNGQPDYNAELYKQKALCLLTLNQATVAQQANNKAIALFKTMPELKGSRWQLEAEKISAMIAYALGEYNKAYQLFRNYHEKYVQLEEASAQARLTKVKNSLEKERQNTEISLLEQKAKVQSLINENKSQQIDMQRYFVIFVVLFTLALLIFLLLQQKHTRKVFAVSVRDALTGLYNRHYVFEFLDKTVETTIKKDGYLSVIILDIDDFKMVNDQHGHPFGDEVIREISKICQENHRKDDIVGRIGGEEFFCILPNAALDEAKRIAKRILNNIAGHVFTTAAGKPYSVTVSMGIACVDIETQTSIDLYTQADKALYYAKKMGKNNIVTYQEIKDQDDVPTS
jgi:diguanylate cyclase (GGDEF)-like protein